MHAHHSKLCERWTLFRPEAGPSSLLSCLLPSGCNVRLGFYHPFRSDKKLKVDFTDFFFLTREDLQRAVGNFMSKVMDGSRYSPPPDESSPSDKTSPKAWRNERPVDKHGSQGRTSDTDEVNGDNEHLACEEDNLHEEEDEKENEKEEEEAVEDEKEGDEHTGEFASTMRFQACGTVNFLGDQGEPYQSLPPPRNKGQRNGPKNKKGKRRWSRKAMETSAQCADWLRALVKERNLTEQRKDKLRQERLAKLRARLEVDRQRARADREVQNGMLDVIRTFAGKVKVTDFDRE